MNTPGGGTGLVRHDEARGGALALRAALILFGSVQAVLAISGFIQIARDEPGDALWLAVVLAVAAAILVGAVLVLMRVVSRRAVLRLRRVRQMAAGEEVMVVQATPALVEGLMALGYLREAPVVSWVDGYLALSASSSGLVVWGGRSSPRKLCHIPAERIGDVGVDFQWRALSSTSVVRMEIMAAQSGQLVQAILWPCMVDRGWWVAQASRAASERSAARVKDALAQDRPRP